MGNPAYITDDKKNKYKYSLYPFLLWLVGTVLLLLQIHLSNVWNLHELGYVGAIIVVCITAICGHIVALASFIAAFIFKTISDSAFAYTTISYLFCLLITHFVTVYKWYKSPLKMLFAAILYTFFQGFFIQIGFYFATSEDSYRYRLCDMLMPSMSVIPYAALMVLLPWIFMTFVPDRFKRYFWGSAYYTKEWEVYEKEAWADKKSKLSAKITWIIVLMACILCISSAVFANIILTQYDNLNARHSVHKEFYYFENTNYIIAFDLKLVLLMSNVIVPIAMVINFLVQKFIARPIHLMSEYLKNFGKVADTTDGERNECLRCISEEVAVYTHDEINELIERLQKEKQLEAELALARAESNAKTSFLSNMSHEIRTPINAVLGLDEMILRESSDDVITGYAADIKNAGRSLLSIINDILDFSKIEAGKMEIIPVKYELSSAINDLVNMTSVKAKDKHLNFFVNTDKNVPHKLFGDEIRIKQVILNILSNAVKYTAKGSVLLTIDYEKLDEEYINLLISVQDTGIGIKKEDIDRLYTPFQRVDEERNRTIEGTGLGMSIVQQLLSLMGSSVHVESEYGKGSTFSFAVKQKVEDWEPMGDFTKMYRSYESKLKKYKEKFHAPSAHILVVDDTKLNLTVICGLLKQTQIKVDTAGSGAEALRLTSQNRYDVLFIDHRMPGMDGIETLHVLKQTEGNLNRDVPCIVLTANAISGAKEMYIKEGFDDYLSKPVDSNKLERILIDYLPQDKVEKVQEAETHSEEDSGERDEGSVQNRKELLSLCSIDVEAAIKNCGGLDILESAVKDFYDSIEEKSSLIEQYAKNRDFKNYTVLVHALKSSARLIGALDLSEKAKELESFGDKEDFSSIEKLTPALLSDFRSYKEKLSPAIQKGEDDSIESSAPISSEDVEEALSATKEFIEAFDFDSASMVLEQIESSSSDELKEKIAHLKKLLKSADRDASLKALKEFG